MAGLATIEYGKAPAIVRQRNPELLSPGHAQLAALVEESADLNSGVELPDTLMDARTVAVQRLPRPVCASRSGPL